MKTDGLIKVHVKINPFTHNQISVSPKKKTKVDGLGGTPMVLIGLPPIVGAGVGRWSTEAENPTTARTPTSVLLVLVAGEGGTIRRKWGRDGGGRRQSRGRWRLWIA